MIYARTIVNLIWGSVNFMKEVGGGVKMRVESCLYYNNLIYFPFIPSFLLQSPDSVHAGKMWSIFVVSTSIIVMKDNYVYKTDTLWELPVSRKAFLFGEWCISQFAQMLVVMKLLFQVLIYWISITEYVFENVFCQLLIKSSELYFCEHLRSICIC